MGDISSSFLGEVRSKNDSYIPIFYPLQHLPQSIFYNQVLHIFPIYCLSNAEFSSSLLQHVKQFSTITKSYIPACSNISKLIINNDQALLLHVQNLQTDLNSKYICVVDKELQLHQYPNNMAAVLHLGYLVTKNCY